MSRSQDRAAAISALIVVGAVAVSVWSQSARHETHWFQPMAIVLLTALVVINSTGVKPFVRLLK